MSGNHRLSHSALEMLSKCGEAFRRRYIEREKIPPGVALLVGRSVDESVNGNLTSKMAEGELLPLERVRQIARDTLVQEWEHQGIALDDDQKAQGEARTKGEAIDKSVGLAELHASKVAPALEPTAVQAKFELEVEGFPVTLSGVVDVVEGPKSLRDTKTAGKSPSEDAADLSQQLTMYALAGKVLKGEIPARLHLDFLIDTKVPKVVHLETTRTDDDFQPLLDRVESAVKVIEAGAFSPANPSIAWWCSAKWCGYHSTCRFVRRGASVAVNQGR